MAGCRFGEYLTHPGPLGQPYYFQPPFPSCVIQNPMVTDDDARAGGALDTHNLNSTAFRPPYFNSGVAATQIYRFRCPCYNGFNWVTLMGPHSVNYAVSQNLNGSFKYTLSKTGTTATISPLP